MLEVLGSTSKYRTGGHTGRNSYRWLSGKSVEERMEEVNYFWVGLEVGFCVLYPQFAPFNVAVLRRD
jgi:hypothetical protein